MTNEQKQQMVEALNMAIAMELQAIVQYMWHHTMGKGMNSPEIIDIFRSTSMDEMNHAERIAERIDILGGVPTTKPTPIAMGGDLAKMMQDDLKGEHDAIEAYNKHIALAASIGDHGTRLMLEEILSEEEGHANTWENILED